MDIFSICFCNAELMLNDFYEEYEHEAENFFNKHQKSKGYRGKFKQWLNRYQYYLGDFKLSKEIKCSLILLSIKESFESDNKLIKVPKKHIKYSNKHIILFKNLLEQLNNPDKEHFELRYVASFFLPIFDMLSYVLKTSFFYNESEDISFSNTKLTKDTINSYKTYLKNYIKKIENTTPHISDDSFNHLLEIVALYINLIFLYDIEPLDTYIKNNPI